MAKIRRIIRRMQSSAAPAFDEQLWPINIALVVLGAYISGELWIFTSFTTPNVLSNGWTWLAAVWIGIGLVMWAAWRLGDHRGRRVQFSAVLAMLVIQWMLTASLIVPAFNAPGDKDAKAPAEVARVEKPEEKVMEAIFEPVPPDQVDQQLPHEKPVETEATDAPEAEIPREDPTPPKVEPKQPSPEQVPDEERKVESSPIEKPQPQKSTPHQSETASLQSKQSQLTAPRPDKISSPTVGKAAPKAEPTLEADTPSLTRQKTDSTAQPVAADTPQPAAQEPKSPVAPQAKAAAESSLAKADSPPQRDVKQAQTDTTPVAVPNVAPPQPPALAGSLTEPTFSPQRQASQSPLAGQAPTEIKVADNAPANAAAKPRDQPAPPKPEMARSAQSDARSLEQISQVTDTKAAVPAQTPAQPTAAPAVLAAADSKVGKQAAASPNPTQPKPTVAEVTGDVATTANGATRPQDSATANVPSVRPLADPTDNPRTAMQIAAAPSSPVPLSSPAVSQSSLENERTPDARRPSIDRGAQGIAGGGNERNFDKGELAPRTVSDAASNSAKRDKATSATPDPTALSTSDLARAPSDKAMSDVASSTVKAIPVEQADQSGGQKTAERDASAAAAIQKNSAAKDVGRITAAVGAAEIDNGPVLTAGNVGAGRASGGGDPVVHRGTHVPEASRLAPAGGAPLAASNTVVATPVPTATADADGGGRPKAPEADSRNTAALKADNSTGKTVNGASVPPSDALAGGAAPSSGAPGTSQQRRAPAGEVLPGASIGGGTGNPSREMGVPFAANLKADIPKGTSGPGKLTQGAAGESAGLEQAGPNTGSVAQQKNAPAGGAATPTAAGGGEDAGSGAGLAAGITPSRAASSAGASLSQADAGGSPNKGVGQAKIGEVARVDVPSAEKKGGGPTAAPDAKQIDAGTGDGTVNREKIGGATVVINANEGVGGLGAETAPQAGNLSRSAQLLSPIISYNLDERYRDPNVGGPKQAVNPFAKDGRGALGERAEKPGTPGEKGSSVRHARRQDPNVADGLKFLQRHQSEDGRWSLHNFGKGRKGYENETADIRSDTAGTGLALLAFLGARHDHKKTEGLYNDTIRKGLEHLIKNQLPSGELYDEIDPVSSESARLYSHAIATLALCEAYGMTGDPWLQVPAQKAIDFAVSTQNKTLGGWRYRPQNSTDTSVTGWMFGALDAGYRAQLKVPKEAFQGIDRWLETATAPGGDGSQYVYDPNAGNEKSKIHGRQASPAMTAVGLYIRLTQDWKPHDPRAQAGAKYLLKHLPAHTTEGRDTYYWYYATQVMYHMRGDYWERWQSKLFDELAATQLKQGPMQGSWNPRGTVSDKWGEKAGRIYVTSMNLLSLEARTRVNESRAGSDEKK